MIVLAALALAAAVLAARRPRPQRRRRLVTAIGRETPTTSTARSRVVVLSRLAGCLAVPAAVAIFGIGLGIPVGAAAAVLVLAVGRPPPVPPVPAETAALAADILASCLAAGLTVTQALRAATAADQARLGESAAVVAAALAGGEAAEVAWQTWMADPALVLIARTMTRTSTSGAASAHELRRAAVRLRNRRRSQIAARVQRASIWVVIPLGFCFLPAFVLVSVVPLVVGLFPALH